MQGLHTEQVIRVHVLTVIACEGYNLRVILAVFLGLLVPLELIVRVKVVLVTSALLFQFRIFYLLRRR